jgi:hypothetical protein
MTKKPQDFVVTITTSYWFKASSMEKAKELAAIPSAIRGVQVQTERSIVCEQTGEEDILP